MTSRPPDQYIWNRVFGLASTTASMGLLAKELRPIGMPRLFDARATATSPSGCTACTPVGEMITGIDRSRPITLVSIERSAWSPATWGANPNWSNETLLASSEMPFSAPPMMAL